ncbi:LIM domain-containing protein [Salimicrobium flavidum]|uniref:Uncharacterized protein n=1 Tax=Salimicrobium flavidum TaxID=570947 RepID=A0A1N7JCT2_9BACI|nr:hypothetical protein [Salimicrobium flavidum]SIS47107.1 hypothetical protein SAMN05421687_10537 [Salimicrobium flavidum]
MTHACHYCNKPIRDRDELVTASKWLSIRPYHYRCYNLAAQEVETIGNNEKPLNNIPNTVVSVIMLVVAIFFLMTTTLGAVGNLLGVLSLYPSIMRVLSYLRFERQLPAFLENKR